MYTFAGLVAPVCVPMTLGAFVPLHVWFWAPSFRPVYVLKQ